MKRTLILLAAITLLLPLQAAKKNKQPQQTDREYWCTLAYKMAQPVLENMAKGELQKNMKTEFSPSFDNRDRSVVYMETFGRLMAGIAPWLTLPDDNTAEGQQRHGRQEDECSFHWMEYSIGVRDRNSSMANCHWACERMSYWLHAEPK